MRSRLEADFARFLDEEHAAFARFTRHRPSWQYEPSCFANERGQYLPDFLVVNGARHTYIEVKPANVTGEQLLAALAAMEIVWDSEPDAHLRLVVWTYKAELPPIELDCARTWAEWRLMVGRYDDYPWPADLSAQTAESTIRSFLDYSYPEGPPKRDGTMRRWVAARVWRADGWPGIVRALQAAAERDTPDGWELEEVERYWPADADAFYPGREQAIDAAQGLGDAVAWGLALYDKLDVRKVPTRQRT
jgi:hypothetical protein